jgi:hypothetical protein
VAVQPDDASTAALDHFDLDADAKPHLAQMVHEARIAYDLNHDSDVAGAQSRQREGNSQGRDCVTHGTTDG